MRVLTMPHRTPPVCVRRAMLGNEIPCMTRTHLTWAKPYRLYNYNRQAISDRSWQEELQNSIRGEEFRFNTWLKTRQINRTFSVVFPISAVGDSVRCNKFTFHSQKCILSAAPLFLLFPMEFPLSSDQRTISPSHTYQNKQAGSGPANSAPGHVQ